MELRFPRYLGGWKAMNPLSQEYQRQAAYAMDMAEEAVTDELRAQWLSLARKWLDMVSTHETTVNQTFEQTLQDKGTHQKDSKVSH